MKKRILLVLFISFFGFIAWSSIIEPKKANPESSALPAASANAASKMESGVHVGGKQATPLTGRAKAPKQTKTANEGHNDQAVATEEVPVPFDAVLETGDGMHHHVDFEAFLAAREDRRQRIADQLDAVLVKESPDLEWQQEIASQTRQALEQITNLEGVSVSEIVCSRSICRLMINANNENVHAQITNMSAAIGLMLGSDSWTKPDSGELLAAVYLSRPGEKLPFTGG